MDTATIEKPVSEALSFEEHRALRASNKSDTDTPTENRAKESAPPANKQANTPEDKTETAAKTGIAETNNQEQKPKRDRSTEGRIKELVAQGRIEEAAKIWDAANAKREKERADKLEQELQEYRTRKPETTSKPAVEQPKESKPPESQAPKLGDFVKDSKYTTYEEAHEAWIDARDDYRDTKRAEEKRRSDQQRQEATASEHLKTKVTEARAKYADFDQVAGEIGLGYDPPSMRQFIQKFNDPMGLLYYLGTNQEEHRRILAVSDPVERWAELRFIEKRLSGTPENKTPTVVRKPSPPPQTFGGSERPAPKSTAEASSFEEHRKLRKQLLHA